MILHTLNALPASTAFRDCMATIGADDALLLLGDGVYALLPEAWKALVQKNATVYVLADDLAAAGLTESLPESVNAVDYAGFVALTETYPRQMAWH